MVDGVAVRRVVSVISEFALGHDAERADHRQCAAFLAIQLVHVIAVDDQFARLAARQVKVVHQPVARIIKNGLRKDGQTWDTITTKTSGATLSRIEQQTKNSAVCYSLDLEAGGKAYKLAGGMDETTANGLMHDVSTVLKFSKA